MIIRDENGKAISVESISDLTHEIRSLEETIAEAVENKKNGSKLSDDEKDALKIRIEELKNLVSTLDEDMKKKAKLPELLAFIKELTKFKKFVEDLKKLAEND